MFADAVAIEVGVGAVAVFGLALGASILAGFTIAGVLIRAPLVELGKLARHTNTLIQIMGAREPDPFRRSED